MLEKLRKIIIILCCFLLSWGFIVPIKAQEPYYVMAKEFNNVGGWHDGWIKTNSSTPGLRQFRSNQGASYNVYFYGFIALIGSDYHVFFINQKSLNSGAKIYGRREISAGSYGSQFDFPSVDYSFSEGVYNYSYTIYHLGPAAGEFTDSGDVIAISASSVLPVVDFGSLEYPLTKKDIYDYVYNNDFPAVSNYGDPVVDYTVSVAGTGQAAANNLDNITFYNYFDDGTKIPYNAVFSLRVVPGTYQDQDRTSLFGKTYQDFTLDTLEAFNLGEYSPGETVSFMWSDIIPHFSFFERLGIGGVLVPFIENNIWSIFGWSYQYKLTIGDYESDWKTIYTATSSGASESQTITNNNYDESVYNAFQTINNINNITNNVYNYNGSTVPVSSPTPTPSPSPTPETTVQDPQSHGLLSKILNFIKNIFSTIGDLFNWLKDLLSGDITDHASEIQDTMEDLEGDSGMFFEAFDVLDDLEDHLVDLDPFPPVMEYDDFRVGETVIVPAGNLDFRNIWSYIGTTQEEVYGYTDFAIGLSIFWLITRRVLDAMMGSGGSEE